MPLNDAQRAQLLKPLNASRIAKRKQGSSGPTLSYLEAWDVKAHLTRIFGFGGWSSEVIESSLVAEAKNGNNYDVSWKVVLRLTIHGIRNDGGDAVYTEAAIGTGHIPQLGEAHDMAIKTAESDAIKRCAINLGTQFGLSLYDNGATRDVIRVTLDHAAPEEDAQQPVTGHGVTLPQEAAQEPADGPDGASPAEPHPDGPEEPTEAPEGAQAVVPPADSPGAEEWITRLKAAVEAKDVAEVVKIKQEASKKRKSSLVYQGQTIGKWCDLAVMKAGVK